MKLPKINLNCFSITRTKCISTYSVNEIRSNIPVDGGGDASCAVDGAALNSATNEQNRVYRSEALKSGVIGILFLYINQVPTSNLF